MATTPYFHWPPHSSAGGAPDPYVAGFGSGAPEIALVAPATAAAADTTALVSPELAVAARPRMRRNSSGSGKQQQKPGGGAKKPPQRGLGVAELERLRCGGDPLRELGVVGAGETGAQVHPLLHCDHHHHVPASAFDARYCSSQLVQPPPASPRPTAPGCYVHHPAATGCQRAPSLAPEQQYFMDRWGRMGPGFSPAGNGTGGDHQAQLPPPLAPEHPSSQSTIWRPAASSSSSCLQSDHRCDLCARRMARAFAERGAPPPAAAPPSPTATATTVPDYSIYDLAAAMANARQGEAAFVVRGDRKRGAMACETPAKKEVREIEFFPAASTHHAGGLEGSEFVAPMSSSYGAGSCAAPPPLDLSLRL